MERRPSFICWVSGDVVREAPYALEKLIDSYDDESIQSSPQIKAALLTSTVKLFFVRAPEVQHMLGRLLSKATDDVSQQDLHDRALLYYRLLATNQIQTIKNVIQTNPFIGGQTNFTEEQDEQLRSELMEEFNSLSTLYGKRSEEFIGTEYQVKYVKMPPEHPLDPNAVAAPPPPQQPVAEPAAAAVPPPAAAATSPPAGVVDLLGFGDSAPAPAAPPAPPSFALVPISISGDEYQTTWGAIPDAQANVVMVPLKSMPTSTGTVETSLAAHNVQTMASGELPQEFKFFLYAKSAGNSLFLVQSNISKTEEPVMILTVKVQAGGGAAEGDVAKLVEFLGDVFKVALG